MLRMKSYPKCNTKIVMLDLSHGEGVSLWVYLHRILMSMSQLLFGMIGRTYYKFEDIKHGLTLVTSPWKRPSPESIPFEAKASGPYLICTLSKSYAEENGYNEALMLDYRGYVAEATSSNIFLIKDNEIHTPIPDCFLNGITRQTVIDMVKNQGFKLVERHIKPDELKILMKYF